MSPPVLSFHILEWVGMLEFDEISGLKSPKIYKWELHTETVRAPTSPGVSKQA